MNALVLLLTMVVCASGAEASQASDKKLMPEKLVVLTFDDSVASHYSVVRPLLKRHKFGATFFITEGFTFVKNKKDYMTWKQIKALHDDGFEIGNHTRSHMGVSQDTLGRLVGEISYIARQCEKHGIPRPVSFAYPGNAIHHKAFKILQSQGIRFARRGGFPEFPYKDGRGVAYEPGLDHPLLIPSAGDARPHWTLADFKRAVAQGRRDKVVVLQFHGVPDNDHPWVHTPPKLFEKYMQHLQEEKCTVIALRDLSRFIDHKNVPAKPLAIIESRKAKLSGKQTAFVPNSPEAAAIIETTIRRVAEKCTGELTRADLGKVTVLFLLEAGLTDVSALAKLTKLEELHIWGNKLTSLSPLTELKHLETLDLRYNPNLTKAEIAKLQKALPKCKITHDATK